MAEKELTFVLCSEVRKSSAIKVYGNNKHKQFEESMCPEIQEFIKKNPLKIPLIHISFFLYFLIKNEY